MLEYGEDSKQIMQTKNAPDTCIVENGWKHVESMKTLGSYVSNNGSCEMCVEKTIEQMWKAFHANMSPGLLAASEKSRMCFIQNSLMSIATWKWARWPFCKSVASKLDSVQTHFIQLLFPAKNLAGESADAYFLRIRMQSGRLASKIGRWSAFWAGACKAWASHLDRGATDKYWACQIYTYLNFSDLELRRLAFSRGSKRDRTNTRAAQGHVHKRWHDGLELARSVISISPSLPVNSQSFGT